MREVVFRGKRVDNGEWVYGSLINNMVFDSEFKEPVPFILDPNAVSEDVHFDSWEHIESGLFEVDPETVGQYLGIADKNGDKVFRGDILKYTQVIYTDCSKTEIEEVREPAYIEIAHYHPMGSVVKPWTKGVRAFVWDTETGEGLTGEIESDEIEIVCNRWDNPEILEV